jgi:hypothetical protein
MGSGTKVEIMSQENIDFIEKTNTGTSSTKNQEFDKNGYLVIKNLYDVSSMIELPPKERGQISYNKNGGIISHLNEETQVNGSLSRYNYPKYLIAYDRIKSKIESVIGCELYSTYFYDRFYFKNQELTNHIDRDSCEISVSLHISSGPKKIDWSFGIKSCEGHHNEIILNSGDAILYKGCERPHWRKKMPLSFRNILFTNNTYYHQIFMHYVLANGRRAHFAFDRK